MELKLEEAESGRKDYEGLARQIDASFDGRREGYSVTVGFRDSSARGLLRAHFVRGEMSRKYQTRANDSLDIESNTPHYELIIERRQK